MLTLDESSSSVLRTVGAEGSAVIPESATTFEALLNRMNALRAHRDDRADRDRDRTNVLHAKL